MQHYLPSGYGPIDRSQILARSDARDDMRPPGRLLLIVPGVNIDWTLIPDRRDVRRWYAVDLDGTRHAHAAWPTIMRMVAHGQPQALGRRHW
jgi:hypothetical protein